MIKISLIESDPIIASEWDYEKNGDLKPEDCTRGQKIKVFWKCDAGHSYKARIDHRCSMSSGCPYCSHIKVLKGETDLKTLYPDLAAEWDYENNTLDPDEVFPQSNKTAFWICPVCKRSYKKKIQDRTVKGASCPDCYNEYHTSMQEQAVLFYYSKVTDVINRHVIQGKEIDVYLPEYKTGIEYNGEYYHAGKKKSDMEKYQHLSAYGIRVIVIQCGRSRSVENDVITLNTKTKINPTDQELEWGIKQSFDLIGITPPEIRISDDRISIYKQYIKLIKENSLAERFPDVAKKWNYVLNKGMSPQMFSFGSNKTAWWTCSKCHSDYDMIISKRTTGRNGCPYCSGKRVKPGLNDLFTTHPQLAEEWNYEKNIKKPDEVTHGSDEKVWWKCKKCDYEWKAAISSRTGGVGCPYCAGDIVVCGVNDLATINREALEYWNYEKNERLPSEYLPSSNKHVWWKCKYCKHEWEASINEFNRGRRCPECAKKNRVTKRNDSYLDKNGSLAENNPELMNEWDYEKNIDLTPDSIVPGSHKNAWWICQKCGNSWKTKIYLRAILKHGCPACNEIKGALSRRRRVKNVETGVVYEYSQAAADSVGVTRSAIQYACKNNSICRGFHWVYI